MHRMSLRIFARKHSKTLYLCVSPKETGKMPDQFCWVFSPRWVLLIRWTSSTDSCRVENRPYERRSYAQEQFPRS